MKAPREKIMNARIRSVAQVALFVAVAFTSTPVLAECPAVTHAALTAALTGALGGNGGLSKQYVGNHR